MAANDKQELAKIQHSLWLCSWNYVKYAVQQLASIGTYNGEMTDHIQEARNAALMYLKQILSNAVNDDEFLRIFSEILPRTIVENTIVNYKNGSGCPNEPYIIVIDGRTYKLTQTEHNDNKKRKFETE